MNELPGPDRDAREDGRSERQRIKAVYDLYARDPHRLRKWSETEANRYIRQRKWDAILGVMSREGIDPTRLQLLELGAGGGADADWFRSIGVPGSRIVALELLAARASAARRDRPWLMSVIADGASLPFADERFDLVYQSTMLSSVLDPRRRCAILAEVGRTLAPGGVFLSYDVRYPNPWNPHTRPVRAAEVTAGFAGWRVWSRSLTLIPQVLRVLAPAWMGACRLLDSLPVLHSHLMVVAVKPGRTRPSGVNATSVYLASGDS